MSENFVFLTPGTSSPIPSQSRTDLQALDEKVKSNGGERYKHYPCWFFVWKVQAGNSMDLQSVWQGRTCPSYKKSHWGKPFRGNIYSMWITVIRLAIQERLWKSTKLDSINSWFMIHSKYTTVLFSFLTQLKCWGRGTFTYTTTKSNSRCPAKKDPSCSLISLSFKLRKSYVTPDDTIF